MKLNCNCVRDVLFQLENSLICEQQDDTFSFKTVKLDKLAEKLSDKYSSNEILYTVCKLQEENYIKAKIVYANSQIVYCEIFEITKEGHSFVDSMRPKSTWENLLKALPTVSSVSTIANTLFQISTHFIP